MCVCVFTYILRVIIYVCVCMYVCRCMYAYTRICVCMQDYNVLCLCIPVYMYVCGCTRGCMHMWRTCVDTCVSVLGVFVDSPSSFCVCWRVTAFRTRSDDPNSVTADSNLYPFWTRCTGDSKTDLWDDP